MVTIDRKGAVFLGKQYDEPMFDHLSLKKNFDDQEILMNVKDLCQEQNFAVLGTDGEGHPYTSLIYFAASEDLKQIAFVTPKETRKFSLLSSNKRVSLLVDNRSYFPDNLSLIHAVTITGNASVLRDEADIKQYSSLFLNKHPHLVDFLNAQSSELILIKPLRFFYVRRFQEVYQWIP